MNKKDRRKLLGAVAEDSLSIALYVVPVSTLKTVGKKLIPQKFLLKTFIDWEEEIKPVNYYYNHTKDLLKFKIDGISYLVPQVIIFLNLDNQTKLTDISIIPKNTEFFLSKEIIDLTYSPFKEFIFLSKLRLQKLQYGEGLRLSSYNLRNNKLSLTVQPVRYEDYVKSNLLIDYILPTKKSLRQKIHLDGKLPSIQESQIANSIGINCLLFTSDGSAILQQRSRKVIVRPKQLSSSASGALVFTDIGKGKMKMSSMHLFREAFEEIGIHESDLYDENLTLLALTRELKRGGKPELFFYANLNLTKEEVKQKAKKAQDIWERKKELIFWNFKSENKADNLSDDQKFQIINSYNSFLYKYGDIISVPLLTNIILWIDLKLNNTFIQQ